MTKIIVLNSEKDDDAKKIAWMKKELEKRDLDIISPKITDNSFEEWDPVFKDLMKELTPDTIIFAKGLHVQYLLKEFETRPIGIKGVFLVLDSAVQKNIVDINYNTTKKKAIKFFVYTFQSVNGFPQDDGEKIANQLETELFILEGANDNSDYEEILIDIISLEHQA